jgi:cell division protein ZapA
MSAAQEAARVSVRILEKEYFIACPHEERSALLDAAEFLNSRMREIRDSGKVVGLDRIAVMVALNLANDLLKQKSSEVKLEGEVGGRVKVLRERAEKALAKGKLLEL